MHSNAVVMSGVPRDPGAYYPSQHAVLRKRRRNVDWDWVSDAIRHGDVKTTPGEDTCTFVHAVNDKLLYVCANYREGEIVTVAWEKD